jgi:GT2 family glycosyltransferase
VQNASLHPPDPTPRVNVIILNWNNYADTMKSVRSSLQQTYANLRVTLVDNGSTNESADFLRALEDPRLKFIASAENLGFSGGVNLGLEDDWSRDSEYILLLNNDASLAADAVAGFVAYMEANPRVGIAGGVVLNEHDDEVQVHGGGHVHPLTGSCRRRSAEDPDFISGALMFIRRDALAGVERLSEDYFMYWEDVAFAAWRPPAGGWAFASRRLPGTRPWRASAPTAGATTTTSPDRPRSTSSMNAAFPACCRWP